MDKNYTDEARWRSVFRDLSWRRKLALLVWALCVLGSFLPTSTSVAFGRTRFYVISTLQRLVLITIPLVIIWFGTWLSDDDDLDTSAGTLLKQIFGYALELIAWISFARLIGFYLLGPLVRLIS